MISIDFDQISITERFCAYFGADDTRYTEFARDDGRMTSDTALIRDYGRRLLEADYIIGSGHNGNQYISFLDLTDFLNTLHYPDSSARDTG